MARRNIFPTLFSCLFALKAGVALAGDEAKPAAPAVAPPARAARPSPTNEISVTLFGQPCILSGAMDKDTLRTIHAISPEQTFVDPSSVSADPIRRSLEKLRNARNVPVWLESYRERRIKRLDAQLAFATGLSSAKKNHKAEPLLTSVKSFIPEKKLKTLSAAASEIESKKPDANLDLRLSDLFNEMIEPDPEEDFHRAIRRMNVHYDCEFSDEGDDAEDGPESTDTAPAAAPVTPQAPAAPAHSPAKP